MSSFPDTEGRTFYGGTYFPPVQFASLLERISILWSQGQSALLDQAKQLADVLKRANDLTITKDVAYPEPIDRELGFERSVLSLHEGLVVLHAQTADPDVRQLQVRLQTCSDEVCLPPETLTLTNPR